MSLELRVAQRALRNGRSAKEVALMLVAGSETVRLIYDKQGRKEAIAFAQHIVTIASQNQAQETQTLRKRDSIELEM